MAAVTAEAIVNLQRFANFKQAVEDGMNAGLEQAGKYIVQLASELAPEETGALKGSGESYVSGMTLEVTFGNGLPDDRALAQEYGTIYAPAQPYLSVAVKEIDIVEEMAKAIRSRLL